MLKQLRFEIGLLLLTTVAMVASMFVEPTSSAEKFLVMLSIYSAVLMIVAGGLHLAILFARKIRAR